MEDRVDIPGRGEVELGSHRGYKFRDNEGAVPFGG
jgi:hypothetical protein